MLKRFKTISHNVYEFILKYEHILLCLLITVGIVVRLFGIADTPVGLNQDEASTGYEAFSILTSGMDRNGDTFPVLLTSWGSGQNVLYTYLSIPFIAIFGLNVFSVRLLSALVGCATLVIFYLLAKKIKGSAFALVSLLLLVINPWNIMISRWALESNLLPFCLLLGIYFTVLSFDKPKFLIGAAIAFGISLYAYGTAFIFLPTFLIAVVIYMAVTRKLKLRCFIPALLIFAVIAFPITLCNVINSLKLEEIKILGVTLPILTETRQASTMSLDFMTMKENFRSLIKLLFSGTDELPFNSFLPYGTMYFFGIWLSIGGVVVGIIKMIKEKRAMHLIMIFALLSSLIAGLFIDININRINMIFLPLIYFEAVFVHWIFTKIKLFSALPIVALCAVFVMFINSYFTDFNDTVDYLYFDGFGEALTYAESVCENENIYITRYVNQPYIFVLFYNQIPVDEFISTVVYENESSPFREVLSFSKYRFTYFFHTEGLYVIHTAHAGNMEILKTFGNYSVCRKQ